MTRITSRNALRAFSGACLALVALLGLSFVPAPSVPAPVPASVTADPGAGPSAAETGSRLVVLGFDGADGRTIEELMAAYPGQYPAFERLRDGGTFARLGTISPPESPVSWAALNTGQNPGKTGVPGFVKRDFVGDFAIPGMGHLVDEEGKLEDFENTPIPAWSAGKMAAVGGAAAFLVFLLVFAVLLKLRFPIAAALALVLGGVGAWCGYTTRGMLAESYPRYGNPTVVPNFWEYLADADVESMILGAPQAFDMPAGSAARVLAGLGVPDAKGNLGDWALYTTDEAEFKELPEGRDTGTAGSMIRVYPDDAGKISTRVLGPINFWALEKAEARLATLEEKLKDPSLDYQSSLDLIEKKNDVKAQVSDLKKEATSVPMTIEPHGDGATIAIAGESQEVAVGEWSDYYHLSFELNWLLKVHAITRVKLIQLEPHMEVFVNVLDIDPEKPPFWQAISTPFAFSAELAKDGPYETYGWPTATMPFKDEVVAPELLMEDVEFTMGWRERLTYSGLQRDDWRVFMSVFSTTDRVQHMMYQYYDEEHPLYVAEEADKTFSFFGETISRRQAIPKIYQHMDRVIGTVMDEHMGPDDTLLVCSDHGFQSFRRQVHVNNFLAERGFLKVKAGSKGGDMLGFVDWSETKAYCVGLGFIYLNLEGRESTGIVPVEEADALLEEIRQELLAYEDEETGARISNDAYIVSTIHDGPFVKDEADIITGFAPGYRVSWGTTLGGIHMVQTDEGGRVLGPVCVDNDKTWSGGHVSVATPDVAGVFFCNRPVDLPKGGVDLLHIAPTVLDLMDVPVPAEMDRAPLDLR